MIKKIFFSFIVLFISVHSSGQNLNKLLGKAFTSQDSSDYYFAKAKKIANSESDLAEYFFCKNARCTDYNEPDSAIYYGKIALEKMLKINKKATALTVINNMAKVYQAQGQYDNAIEVTLKGLKIAEQENNDYWNMFFTISLARNYHDFESYEKGVFYGLKGFQLTTLAKKQDKDMIAYALNTIAINYDDWGKPEKALYYHKKTFDYQKGKDTLKLAGTYNNIGNTLQKQKKYTEALKWFKRSLKIHEITLLKKDDSYYYNFATVYTNLGTNAFKLKDYSEAEKFFEKAKFFAVKSEDAEKLRDFYYQSGKFYKEQKNLTKIIETQEEYLALRDSIFNKDRDKNFAEIQTKYETATKDKLLLQSQIETKNRNFIILGLIFLSVFISLVGYLIFRQQKLKNVQQAQSFELKQAIAQIETQNKLQSQRLSISKDLHDTIGAQLTFIISSVETTKFAPELQNTKLGAKLTKISDFTKDTIVELRDTIWAMNTDEFSFADLRIRIFNFIEKAKSAVEDIQFDFSIEEELSEVKFSSLVGINIYRTIQEALNNAIKYSNGNAINVVVKSLQNGFKIEIQDNGKGFDLETIDFGNGLHNMQKRIEEIQGTFDITSEINVGTTITIVLHQTQNS